MKLPHLSPRFTARLSPAAALLALAFSARPIAPAAPAAAPEAPRTVILVRHAEKGADDPRDPSLSEAGRARAQALAQLLARSGAKRLIATEFKRTQETLAPLGAALGLEVEKAPAGDADAIAESALASAPGSTTVIAGHSNTVPAIAARLGAALPGVAAGPKAALDDAEYDRLFVLTLAAQGSEVAPAVLELAYGASSP